MLLTDTDNTGDTWKHTNPEHTGLFKPYLLAEIKARKRAYSMEHDLPYKAITVDLNVCIGDQWLRLPQAHALAIITRYCDKAGQEFSSTVKRAETFNRSKIRAPNIVYELQDSWASNYGGTLQLNIFFSSGRLPNLLFDKEREEGVRQKEEEE